MAFLDKPQLKKSCAEWALSIELCDDEPIKIPWWSSVYENFSLLLLCVPLFKTKELHACNICVHMCVQLGAAWTVIQKPHSIQDLYQETRNSAFAAVFKIYSEKRTHFQLCSPFPWEQSSTLGEFLRLRGLKYSSGSGHLGTMLSIPVTISIRGCWFVVFFFPLNCI